VNNDLSFRFDSHYVSRLTCVIPVTSLGCWQTMVGEPRWFGGTVRYR
jgi:hypothetical protein